MKRLITLIFTLLLCIISIYVFAETDELYSYEINEDNTVTITKFNWNNNHGDIYIPEMLGNRMVTVIGSKSFATTGNRAVKITLPDCIKTIEAFAFQGTEITYINIPIGTVEINEGAFAQCSVSRFNVASGHPVFATIENALYNKQTKTLIAWPENKDISDIPEGIVNIGDYAFYGRTFPYGNSYSVKFNLPKTIRRIGKYSFADIKAGNYGNEYDRLEINLQNIEEIDDYAFYKAPIAPTTQLSVLRIGAHAFEKAKIDLAKSELNFKPYVIDSYAFYECYFRLKNERDWWYINLNHVTSIGKYAFSNFDGDNAGISIGENDLSKLTYIGEHAFDCYSFMGHIGYSVKGDVVLSNEELEYIDKEAFINTDISSVTIGSSTKAIKAGAFANCTSLKKVVFSDGLETIEDNAFNGCYKLKEISIPSTVTLIGNDVFKDCSSLVIMVESGSYAEIWARTSGYSYKVNGIEEDTSWLN